MTWPDMVCYAPNIKRPKFRFGPINDGAVLMNKFFAQAFCSNFGKVLLYAAALGVLAPAAQAQFSDSYNFLKAVKDQNGAEAIKYIQEPGSGAVIINTRDAATGETGLHIVVKRRDSSWTGFLLQKGANPNVTDKQNVTPLILASQLGFIEGVDWLLRYKANVDQANRSGETPLILATQLRNAEMVRLLLKKGADPDKTDNVTGMSARDYATRDRRNSSILAIIEANNNDQKSVPEKSVDLDFSGIGEKK
jgi:uncharacterized protein